MNEREISKCIAEYLLSVLLAFLGGVYVGATRTTPIVEKTAQGMPDGPREPSRDIFRAICLWEGRGDIRCDAYNKKENARGPAQIRPCYLQDANEWLKSHGLRQFTHMEMHDYECSFAVWAAYMARYKAYTPEQKARIHNGGPNGYKLACTIPYWEGVKSYLEIK